MRGWATGQIEQEPQRRPPDARRRLTGRGEPKELVNRAEGQRRVLTWREGLLELWPAKIDRRHGLDGMMMEPLNRGLQTGDEGGVSGGERGGRRE